MRRFEVVTVNETLNGDAFLKGRDEFGRGEFGRGEFGRGNRGGRYVDENEQLREYISIVVGSFTVLSQVFVMLIAKGLPGNFSSSTFLMAQAAAEMWKRFNMAPQTLCDNLSQ